MDSAVHAARGALAAGGGLALLQSLLARRLRKPSGYALLVCGFVGTFRFLESLGNAQLGGAEAARRHVPSAAAGVAALVAVYFLEAKKKGLLLSYAALEAILLLIKEHTSIADWKHIQAPMAVLTLHRIIYIWIYESDMLTKAQLATLDGLTLVSPEILTRVRAELPVDPLVSRCDLFHAGQTCTEFHTGFLQKHLKTAMKLYIPIYFFSAVLTKYDKWIWGPRPRVPALVFQYLRTCAFLSLSFSIPVGFSCVSPIKNHRVTVALAGMLTGLAISIEHEKRRTTVIKSIALYPLAAVGARVAHTLALSPRTVSLWQYVVFSVSMAVLFQRPERQNTRIMRMLFGHRVRSSSPQPANDHPKKSKKVPATEEPQAAH